MGEGAAVEVHEQGEFVGVYVTCVYGGRYVTCVVSLRVGFMGSVKRISFLFFFLFEVLFFFSCCIRVGQKSLAWPTVPAFHQSQRPA